MRRWFNSTMKTVHLLNVFYSENRQVRNEAIGKRTTTDHAFKLSSFMFWPFVSSLIACYMENEITKSPLCKQAMWKRWTCVSSQKFANLVKQNSYNCFVILSVCLLRMQCFRTFFECVYVSLELCVFAFGYNGIAFIFSCRSDWLKWQSGYWMPWETVSLSNNNRV